MVGSSKVSWFSRYFANASALGPLPRNSTQPEESTTYRSEPLGVVTVLILPLHALGDSAKIFYGPRPIYAYRSVEHVNLQFLPGAKRQFFANFLGNDHLQ